MARVKRGNKRVQRRKKILGLAKGFYGTKSKAHRMAKQAVDKSLSYAYRDRRQKKRQHPQPVDRPHQRRRPPAWPQLQPPDRRPQGRRLDLDRKILADIAVRDESGFAAIAEMAKQATGAGGRRQGANPRGGLSRRPSRSMSSSRALRARGGRRSPTAPPGTTCACAGSAASRASSAPLLDGIKSVEPARAPRLWRGGQPAEGAGRAPPVRDGRGARGKREGGGPPQRRGRRHPPRPAPLPWVRIHPVTRVIREMERDLRRAGLQRGRRPRGRDRLPQLRGAELPAGPSRRATPRTRSSWRTGCSCAPTPRRSRSGRCCRASRRSA